MLKRSWVTIALCAAALLALGASSAFAGEVTGSGKNADQNQGKSWCSFSGLNDQPDAGTDPDEDPGPNGPGGKSQSFGQDVRLGFASPGDGTPGLLCNPNKTFLPPQPNRK